MSELQELSEELDFEQWLDSEGVTYRRGSVSSRGRELNIKECPHCGSAGWKLYFNVTTGLVSASRAITRKTFSLTS